MDSSRMMLYNAIPILSYIAVCFIMDSAVQLFFAKVKKK